MRKIVAAFILAGLLISTAGCRKETPSQNSTGVATQPTSATTPVDVKPIKQISMVSVSLPLAKDSYTAADKTVIFNNVYQDMQLITSDPGVADKVIIDYLNQTESISDALTMQKLAEDAYKSKPPEAVWNAYLSQISYMPTRIDQGVLSLFGNHTSYTGGAHGNIVGHSLNYDLISGQRLSLSDIFTSSVNPQYISALVLNALAQQEGLFQDYEDTVTARFGNNMLQDKDWYLTNSGLCFFFSPYEIAAFAAGTISAEIPYNALTGTLKDAYFPAERESTGGCIQISPFDKTAFDQYTQFAEVVLEKGADKILLHSDEGVYDIRLESGFCSADGKNFTVEHTVFASYALTPGDALIIESDLGADLPQLRLCYTSGDKMVKYFILSNGSYHLSPA